MGILFTVIFFIVHVLCMGLVLLFYTSLIRMEDQLDAMYKDNQETAKDIQEMLKAVDRIEQYGVLQKRIIYTEGRESI